VTNEILYVKLPKLSDKIAARRLRLAGHCQRHPELVAHRVILWEPTHGQRGRGRPKMTCVDQLKSDTETTTTGELAAMMNDRTTLSGGELWILDCGRDGKGLQLKDKQSCKLSR